MQWLRGPGKTGAIFNDWALPVSVGADVLPGYMQHIIRKSAQVSPGTVDWSVTKPDCSRITLSMLLLVARFLCWVCMAARMEGFLCLLWQKCSRHWPEAKVNRSLSFSRMPDMLSMRITGPAM